MAVRKYGETAPRISAPIVAPGDAADPSLISAVDVSATAKEPEVSDEEIEAAVLEPSPSAELDGPTPDLAVFTGEVNRSRYRIFEPSPEKHFQWVSPRTLEKGLFLDWPEYTPQMYEEDQRKYGTRIPNAKIVDGKVTVLLHTLRWVPMALWQKAMETKERRDQIIRKQLIPAGASQRHIQERSGQRTVVVDHQAGPIA